MNSVKLKLFIVAVFAAFAAGIFFVSNTKTEARGDESETAGKRVEIIEQVANYKTWSQVTKPPKKPEIGAGTIDFSTIPIDNSTVSG